MLRDKNKIYFVTGNAYKFEEARRVLENMDIRLVMKGLDIDEPQSDSLEYVASKCALEATKVLKSPLIVEDSGLFISSLGGFPGPYSSYVYRKVGCVGILKLLKGSKERDAYFKCVVAFASSPHKEPVLFRGFVRGTISENAQGKRAFGFDPIFIPSGFSVTFAKMNVVEKNAISHRGKAFRAFARWFVSKSLKRDCKEQTF